MGDIAKLRDRQEDVAGASGSPTSLAMYPAISPACHDLLRLLQLERVVDDDVGPLAVEVDVVRPVRHVHAGTARRSHVDLERHERAVGEAEELEVERPLAQVERAVAAGLAVGRADTVIAMLSIVLGSLAGAGAPS